MQQTEFHDAFTLLTGNPPFPWQCALFEEFSKGSFPSSCNLPTGLGKTSIIHIWLLALAHAPTRLPRRLVYVVNRRTVVDQSTEEARKLRDRIPAVPGLRERLQKLCAVSDQGGMPLAISTLRGQFADNREWSSDPSRPAVIAGTVDMIGSRLLFSGYGCGYKSRPLHAGFLGQDALLVHDEAHLEPAFQELLTSLEREQEAETTGKLSWPKLRVMELTATSRSGGKPFTLSDRDRAVPEVQKRIKATKTIHLHDNKDKNKLGDEIAELAFQLHGTSNQAVLVFARKVEDVEKIVEKLRQKKQKVQQLTGTMRGRERNRMADPRRSDGCPIFARFLRPPRDDAPESERWQVVPLPGTVYLVCTSAGEVGVNISGDHLVCDLSTFDSMAQRFGRVNRFGDKNDTRIDIVHPHVFEEKDDPEYRLRKTLELLRLANGDGSPASLGELHQRAIQEDTSGAALAPDRAKVLRDYILATFAKQPTILPVTDILFDAWTLTTLRGKLPGRPPVGPYLHGVGEWEPPQTHVAWREEVGELPQRFETFRDRKEFEQYASELLDDYPLKAHELLVMPTARLIKELAKLAAAPETPVWIVDENDTVSVTTLDEVLKSDKDRLERQTLLLPPAAGGMVLDKGEATGLFKGAAKFEEDHRSAYDVADEWSDKDGPLRQRKWDDDTRPPGMKLERIIPIRNADDDDAEPTKVWYWFVRINASADANARSKGKYDLEPHLDDAKAAAESFVAKLDLDAGIRQAVIVAAAYHDLGKDRKLWQQGIGNSAYPQECWAKSGKRAAAVERSTYRHEFGSLLDVVENAEFKALTPEQQDLVLHLIAAHHGRGRPHFPADEAFDHEPRGRDVVGAADAVPERFARLQRKYGRWGLAYLESLVRAADILASQKAEGGGS